MLYIIIFLCIGFLLGFLKYFVLPIVKGFIGEKAVSFLLSDLPKEKYILINDVMIMGDKGSTQIDHVLVSEYGIFVIETKNYKGWIYGGEFAEQWTQNIYGHKNKFRNPLKQNYGHIQELMKLLGLPENKFIPIVVFSGSATLKVKSKKPVTYISKIKKVVLGYDQPLFDENEIRAIVDRINTGRMQGTVSEKINHIKNIKANQYEKKLNIENNLCPKCGKKLILRKGKYGDFYGCTGYPQCKFTSNISGK